MILYAYKPNWYNSVSSKQIEIKKKVFIAIAVFSLLVILLFIKKKKKKRESEK